MLTILILLYMITCWKELGRKLVKWEACLVDSGFEHQRREDKCEHQCRVGTSCGQVKTVVQCHVICLYYVIALAVRPRGSMPTGHT